MANKKKTNTVKNETKKDNIEKEKLSKKKVSIDTSKDNTDKSFGDTKKTSNNKTSNNVFTNTILFITIIISLAYFFINILNSSISLNNMINITILVLFSIIYLSICLTYNKKNKFVILISSILLMVYFLLNISDSLNITSSNSKIDFRGKSITEAVKWANKNHIKLDQDYEYSDMIPEYSIITQKVSKDKNHNINKIKVSISEGPNPSKEIVVPSMVTWDSERVINYVKTNYLNNVNVEFIESDKVKDTVIEQNISGNIRRNDELKLTFSYGDEGNENDVKLIDFTNKSKFEIEFFMKQHHLNYNFEEDFSSKVKKGYGLTQDVKAGDIVSVNDKAIIITLSKGPKIKVPNLKNMSSSKITEWAVKNKLRIEYNDKYDDKVAEGYVIDVDKEKGDILEQGATIKVTLSRGKLKMPSFKSIDDFYEWADKYEVKYEIQREFSNSVKSGEVISYSVKTGKTIKNDEVIIVKVSDGDSCEVPNLKGLTKSEAISKLKKADLQYNFIYKSSDSKKDKVLSQSISSGSSITCGTTVTVTLSSGKNGESNVNKRENTNSNSSNNNNNNSNNNTNNNNNGGNNTPSTPSVPEKVCNSCVILKSLIASSTDGYNSCSSAAGNVKRNLEASCPGLTVNVSCENKDGYDTNDFVSGFNGGRTTSCDTISIVLAN